jgi:hypothetical protein
MSVIQIFHKSPDHCNGIEMCNLRSLPFELRRVPLRWADVVFPAGWSRHCQENALLV